MTAFRWTSSDREWRRWAQSHHVVADNGPATFGRVNAKDIFLTSIGARRTRSFARRGRGSQNVRIPARNTFLLMPSEPLRGFAGVLAPLWRHKFIQPTIRCLACTFREDESHRVPLVRLDRPDIGKLIAARALRHIHQSTAALTSQQKFAPTRGTATRGAKELSPDGTDSCSGLGKTFVRRCGAEDNPAEVLSTIYGGGPDPNNRKAVPTRMFGSSTSSLQSTH
jgi:hypothetical protein